MGHASSLAYGASPRSACAPRSRGDFHSAIPSGRYPSARLHSAVMSFHRLSVAALQSEGQHWTLRRGPARQAHSGYSHCSPRRAAGMVGALLPCTSPACYPGSLPLDQSATIGNLCTNPSRMRPLQTPFEHSMPENATSGRAMPHAAVSVASLPAPLPFDLESSTVTIYKQDPCLRRLLPALTVV
jgi:hypothetical protein